MSVEFALPRRRRRIRPYLDLTAMIDTVFNLLIFFAVTTTFVGARTGLPLRLPTARTAQSVPERVVLKLLPGRAVQVNGQEVAAGQVGGAVRRAARGDLQSQVVVLADENVPYRQLVGVLDEVRLADFSRIALAAAPAKAPAPDRRDRRR
jgi:biopolymer transport protein ExbD